MDEYLAIIKAFAGNFAPVGFLECNGTLLSINQNTALFSLIGTMYGGNGQITFGLPDLRGRTMVGKGQSNLGTFYELGGQFGVQTITLNTSNLPFHQHTYEKSGGSFVNDEANLEEPSSNARLAKPALVGKGPTAQSVKIYSDNQTEEKGELASNQNSYNTSLVGGVAPIDVRSPSLVITYIIAVSGLYPSRP